MEKNKSSKILISIGSNENDKKSLLKSAISKINDSIGPVLLVSKIYESPSWGFEADVFYNQSLLCQTNYDMFTCLKKLQNIEKTLGRKTKTLKENYESRPIDIDIIFNDQTIINSDELTIPHYLFDKRRFVLLPTKEIIPNFTPPGYDLNITDLLELCEDEGYCKIIKE